MDKSPILLLCMSGFTLVVMLSVLVDAIRRLHAFSAERAYSAQYRAHNANLVHRFHLIAAMTHAAAVGDNAAYRRLRQVLNAYNLADFRSCGDLETGLAYNRLIRKTVRVWPPQGQLEGEQQT